MDYSQAIITVSSSLTTVLILAIARQISKTRKSLTRMVKEHRFLMRSMGMVLSHLNMDRADDDDD